MSGSQKSFPNVYDDYSQSNSDVIIDKKINIDLLNKYELKISELTDKLINYSKKTEVLKDVSVYTGIAGIALTFFVLHRQFGKERYQEKAIECIDYCLKHTRGRRECFLNGDAGPYAIGAVMYSSKKPKYSMELVEKLTSMHDRVCESPDIPDEMLYGRAGYLYALLFVKKHLGKEVIKDSIIRKVILAILQSGQKLARRKGNQVPCEFEWHGKNYLGGAHGIAGILYMLLLAKDYLTEDELLKIVKPSVNYVLSLQYPSGNFPSSLGSTNDRLVQWCHGAPGVVQLMSKAHEVFGDEKYLQSALKCGEVVWQRGLLWKGYSLCHGTAGNGYTFLQLYQLTHDEKHLHRAAMFGDWCTTWPKRQHHPPDREYSMFEGIAGIAYFLSELRDPENASFPAFSL